MKNKIILSSVAIVLVLTLWWGFSGDQKEATDFIIEPEFGKFEVRVINTGELRAKNSTKILGPTGARRVGVWNMKIQKLIPEGTVVDSGDYVADLDKSELTGKIQDAQLQLQKVESQVTQARLDSQLTLSEARNNLINLKYAVEEKELAVEQALYESPAVKRQAEIDYERSKRSYTQAVEKYKTQTLQSKAKLAEVEADLKKEQRKVQQMQGILGEFTVKAPKSGMVVYEREWNGKKKNVGATISPWNPTVALLPDLSLMESITYINEVDIQKIKQGQKVSIGLDANPEKELTGIVTSIANIGEQRPNSDSKVFEVEIRVNESDTTLRPSMTTSNSILVTELDSVLYVPLESIHSNDNFSYVFIRDGLGAKRQQVRIGEINETHAVILDGIALDQKLYLSMPTDTVGLKWNFLEENITSID